MAKAPQSMKDKSAEASKTGATKSAPANAKSGADVDPKIKSQAKTYSGGCHCGKVRYEMASDVAKVISCNCSIRMKSSSYCDLHSGGSEAEIFNLAYRRAPR